MFQFLMSFQLALPFPQNMIETIDTKGKSSKTRGNFFLNNVTAMDFFPPYRIQTLGLKLSVQGPLFSFLFHAHRRQRVPHFCLSPFVLWFTLYCINIGYPVPPNTILAHGNSRSRTCEPKAKVTWALHNIEVLCFFYKYDDTPAIVLQVSCCENERCVNGCTITFLTDCFCFCLCTCITTLTRKKKKSVKWVCQCDAVETGLCFWNISHE